jgi:ADP-ribosylglycohydrolase
MEDIELVKTVDFNLFSHNHPECVKGAQATAAALYMARTGKNKDEIKQGTRQ